MALLLGVGVLRAGRQRTRRTFRVAWRHPGNDRENRGLQRPIVLTALDPTEPAPRRWNTTLMQLRVRLRVRPVRLLSRLQAKAKAVGEGERRTRLRLAVDCAGC